MAKVTVEYARARWEFTTFEVDVPEGEDPVEYVHNNTEELLDNATDEGIEGDIGDNVSGMDAAIKITDANGTVIYDDPDGDLRKKEAD